MSELESVVRPAQSLDYAPAKTYYQPGLVSTPNTRLQFGRHGQGKVFSGSDSANTTSYMTQYANEKKTPLTSA